MGGVLGAKYCCKSPNDAAEEDDKSILTQKTWLPPFQRGEHVEVLEQTNGSIVSAHDPNDTPMECLIETGLFLTVTDIEKINKCMILTDVNLEWKYLGVNKMYESYAESLRATRG